MQPAAPSDELRDARPRRAAGRRAPPRPVPSASPTPKAVTTSPQPDCSPPSVYCTKTGMIASTAPDPRERDDDAPGHRRCDRVLTEEPDPVAGVAKHAGRVHLLVGLAAERAERDAVDHRRREQERRRVEDEGQRRRAAAERRDTRAQAARDPGEGRERDPADRQRCVGAHDDQRVRVRELPARHEVRQRRVARRASTATTGTRSTNDSM